MADNTYITSIEANQDYKNITPLFKWEDIPKFAVITGENGSGKSALLNGIREGRFILNEHQRINAIIEYYDKFELGGAGYSDEFARRAEEHKNILRQKFIIETDLSNPKSMFNFAKTESANHLYLQEVSQSLTFEDFINRNFDSFSKEAQGFCNSYRQSLDLSQYKKHFERNGMSEEKFYLSNQKEIEKWLDELQDIDFESQRTIFNETALLSFFGNYYIKKTRLRDRLDNEIKDVDQIKAKIKEELGENPLDQVNKLLKKAYSKYTLVLEPNENNQPKLICQNQEGISVPLSELSTGEQIITSLFMWRYEKSPLDSMIFLFDEPDAHLNPKMAKMLIEILKDVIVKEFDCQVIMTTHSLSSVAYCEDEDLFYMEDGEIEKTTKIESMERLSSGVLIEEIRANIELLIESSLILFVEGETDKKHLERYIEIDRQQKGEHIPQSFRIFNCRSASKMEYYADMIDKLKPQLKEKCLFLCDDDNEGKSAQSKVEKFGIKTMLVSQGQNSSGDFTIENCYEQYIQNQESQYNFSDTPQWKLKKKKQFARRRFKEHELMGIKILVNEIKKQFGISAQPTQQNQQNQEQCQNLQERISSVVIKMPKD
ncbi:hypothetical protein BBW65_03615 [Helicobacter enhydrae]|uniref:Endonuclease GajA/Old nuclease/RecF-like AAA domain-containing protein n=1 Tax=Helicobacter enhydrae TaxID=222136 RepID=A0A1B1U5A7_9HELI|nr:ATP-binding protein [Helicobacter enhydrae]ANV97940.1 hypothetical protein BBW65_03615 [Helicobacter enhydrae]